MASLVGSRVERKEDKRFLTGKGRYTADININNQTYAYFVRSPHARAKINKIDVSKALKSSGVVDILMRLRHLFYLFLLLHEENVQNKRMFDY
jgi:carbon-monoxide dehydrogenase large subunit